MKELIGVLAKTLNIGESELSSALLDGDKLKAEAPKFLEDKYAAKFASIKDEEKAKYDEAKKNIEGKVTKETAQKFENALRAKYGLSSEKQGDELLTELYAKVDSFKNATSEPDKVRASDTYLNDINELKKQIEAQKEEAAKPFKTELETLKSKIATDQINSAVLAKADAFISSLQIRDDLPKETREAIIASAKQNILNGAKYKMLENGEIVVVNDDGTLKKDHLNADVKIDDIIKTAAVIIPVKAAGDKGSGGNGGNGGGQGGNGGNGGAYNGPMPKDSAEMTKILHEMRTSGKSTKDDIKAASDAMVAHLTKTE